MPEQLVPFGSPVLCAHGGLALASAPNVRVKVGGAPTVLQATPWTIAGCGLPHTAAGPCVLGHWMTGSVRVMSNGQPLVVAPAGSVTVPSGTTMMAVIPYDRIVLG